MCKQNFKLPIKLDVCITTECWTHYKMMILQTSPFAGAWIASHLDLYLDQNFDFYFGRIDVPYNIPYTNDLLEFRSRYIWEITTETIVDTIIESLLENKYVVVYLVTAGSKFDYHEVFLYGFDRGKKIFNTVSLENGLFFEDELSFDRLLEGYRRAYDYYKLDGWHVIHKSNCFYSFTQITLKTEYHDDSCLFEAIQKINKEADGKIYQISLPEKQGETVTHYSGLSCLAGMDLRLGEYIRDFQFLQGDLFRDLVWKLTQSFKKLYEHQKIIHFSMLWATKQLNCPADLEAICAAYETLLLRMKKLYRLSYKFFKTADKQILYRMKDILQTQYAEEQPVLKRFVDRAFDFYSEQMSYETFLKGREKQNEVQTLNV